jgi:hypothetical protein
MEMIYNFYIHMTGRTNCQDSDKHNTHNIKQKKANKYSLNRYGDDLQLLYSYDGQIRRLKSLKMTSKMHTYQEATPAKFELFHFITIRIQR